MGCVFSACCEWIRDGEYIDTGSATQCEELVEILVVGTSGQVRSSCKP